MKSGLTLSGQKMGRFRDIQWFTVADLPTDKNDQVHRMGNYSNNNFYTVMPFVQDLQNYIKKEQTRRAKVIVIVGAILRTSRHPRPSHPSSHPNNRRR